MALNDELSAPPLLALVLLASLYLFGVSVGVAPFAPFFIIFILSLRF
jgi:hypothetical protein